MHRVPAWDGIRAVAVLMVVAFHAKVPGFAGGFFGVDVFFVLSGYLITRLLVDEYQRTNTIALGRFYVRRLRRLYPALLFFLAVYLFLTPTVLSTTTYTFGLHVRDAALSALYLQDYTNAFDVKPYWLRHLWSLSIEEQFYLAWPIVLLAVIRLDRRRAMVVLLGLYIASTTWRIWAAYNLEGHWSVYRRFDTHCAGLFLGCMLGYAKLRLPASAAAVGLAGLAFAMAAFPHASLSAAACGFTVAELSSALLVVAQPRWLAGTILPWIGKMSYGIYLWHYIPARILRGRHWAWPEQFVATLFIGLAGAVVSYYLVERRFHVSLPVNRQGDVGGVPVATSH